MSDISKCNNTECPSHLRCWRHLAPSNELWQAYAPFDPDGKEKCDYFIEAEEWKTWKRK